MITGGLIINFINEFSIEFPKTKTLSNEINCSFIPEQLLVSVVCDK